MKLKRKTILFTVLVLVIIGVLLWFFFFLNKSEQGEITQEAKNLFPFGTVEVGNKKGDTLTQSSKEGTQGEQESGETEVKEPIVTAGPRLRQISSFPTGGFVPLIKTEKKEVSDIAIDRDGKSSQIVQTIDIENPYVRFSGIKEANIYETALTPSSLQQELLVENFIPNAEHAFFSADGNHILFQYWNNQKHVPETYLANLKKRKLNTKECPYQFNFELKLGDDSEKVLKLHEFLNLNPKTQVATKGINAPGAESSLVIPSTITAIKNFQSLYGLDIDGKLGPATSKKMLEICDAQMLKKAQEEFDALETKYTISGSFLPQNIVSLTINPSGSQFFYLLKKTKGVIGSVYNFITEKETSIFESPYTEWLAQWNSENAIELRTKPSYRSPSYSYSMNASSGDYHKSLRQEDGMITLVSPDNQKILFSKIDDEGVSTGIFDRKLSRSVPLILQTFPDKCTWSSDSKYIYCAVPQSLSYGREYPDVWYQGLEFYDDTLWRIEATNFKEDLISDFAADFDAHLDIEKIAIDQNSEYLYFIDKKTEYLWSYRLQDA